MSISLLTINPAAAGIDIGSEKVFIATPDTIVKSYATYTHSFKEAVHYLQSKGITTVAMEATGVYWIALYDMIEKSGIEVYVVNSQHIKYVPGRKTDVQDCQWIQQLHSLGLLKKSFIPADTIRELRCYTRLREDHIQMAAQHIQHMHKALTLMNIRLYQVISQIQGTSGMRIIKAILAGERDAETLTALCERSILKTKREEVRQSLEGNYREEYLFMLQQAITGWEFYQTMIASCDAKIEHLLKEMTKEKPIPENTGNGKPMRHHKPAIENLHCHMVQLTGGLDITRLPGITDYTLMQLVAEVGTDLSLWATSKHFTSWLGLAPRQHSSGKMKRQKRMKSQTRAGQIFREAAQTLLRSKHIALGVFARRLKSRTDARTAIKATARKLAVMFYDVMTKGMDYVEQGIAKYQERVQISQLRILQKKATSLGFNLVPMVSVH